MRVKPPLVAHRVKKGIERDGINEQEAQEIAALVAAVCQALRHYAVGDSVIELVVEARAAAASPCSATATGC